MKHQLQTIRAAIELATPHYQADTERFKQALTALSELEAMAGEPVAYAIFAENGNIRLWSTESQHVKRIAQEKGLSLVPLYAAPVAQQHKTVTNDEQASAYMDARLWEFIDMAGMWPKAKPDPRIWAHVMVYAPPAQQARADLEAENQRLRESLETIYEAVGIYTLADASDCAAAALKDTK